MAKGRKRGTPKALGSYVHKDKERLNNPPAGLAAAGGSRRNGNGDDNGNSSNGGDIGSNGNGGSTTYHHDPHIDPHLSWAGKAEGTSFEVPTVSLHVHERIDSKTIIQTIRKDAEQAQQPEQPPLFDSDKENLPLHQAIEFYRHSHGWSNRLVAGDSLLVMNSLLQKEGLGGKVQTVYMDPPYGINYKSNFQPFTDRSPSSGDKAEDLSREPETIKAFRDTWKLGIHSYLSYLRDRLLLARHLLDDSGSCFVQIGKENLHRVALVMDEVFGAASRIATITYTPTGATSSDTLPEITNYLLWYAKNRKQVKYRQMYEELSRPEMVRFFTWNAMVEEASGHCRKLTDQERVDPERYLPEGSRLYQRMPLDSQGASTTGRSESFEWEGRQFKPGAGRQWAVSHDGLEHLAELNRLDAAPSEGALLQWKRYEDEVPGRKIHNVWTGKIAARNKSFVLQTAKKVIERALLMTTDPGDLVLDPTCGSGTTAVVAEQWGRRWISCDSSRVALTIARQRLMTETYPYYRLTDPEQGVGAGFCCHSVQDVSAGSLAYDRLAEKTFLYDRPEEDSRTARVTGPFTVEAVPAPTVRPPEAEEIGGADLEPVDHSAVRTEPSARYHDWIAELEKTGARGKGGKRIFFNRLELHPGSQRYLHAVGETAEQSAEQEIGQRIRDSETPAYRKPQRVAVCFGPDHAPMGPRMVEDAIKEAQNRVPRPEILIFAAFHFDPEATKNIDQTDWPGVTLLKAQMNADLLTEDLKKEQPGSESFLLIGQPDAEYEKLEEGKHKGQFQVRVGGFDYYDVLSGEVLSGGADQIAIWMLDTDYDGRSLYPKQVFLPIVDDTKGWARLTRTLKAEIDPERLQAYKGTESLPFQLGQHNRVAVKIVDNRGVESLRILQIRERNQGNATQSTGDAGNHKGRGDNLTRD